MIDKMFYSLRFKVALLIFAGTATVSAAVSCDANANEPRCFNCEGLATCSSAGVLEKDTAATCQAGQACMEAYGSAFCAPADQTDCNKCDLGTVFCDLYDPQSVVVCVSGRAPIPITTCGQGEICSQGKCVESGQGTAPTCADVTGPTGVYRLTKPACNSGVFCFNGEIKFPAGPCSSGQYFNPETGRCASLPVQLCQGKGDGLFPHMTDCTKTVVCQGGKWIMDIPCQEGELLINGACTLSTDTSNCPPLDGCTFATDGASPDTDTTTPVPGPTQTQDCTKSNVNKRYPVENDCKKYSTCREVARNKYQMVTSSCPGSLVFNSDSEYCDFLTNVPACTVTN